MPPQAPSKTAPVLVIQKNRLLPIASAHHMVNRRAYSNLNGLAIEKAPPKF
jgi:hypothetical protein